MIVSTNGQVSMNCLTGLVWKMKFQVVDIGFS